MAFSVNSKKSGKTYFLHHRLQKLRGGQEVTLYYSPAPPGRRARCAARGLRSLRKRKTGLPLLKKKK